MAINSTLVLSALTTYVDQIGMPNIITESVFSARTAKLVNVQTGVKGIQALNIMTVIQNWQPASCGLINATGSVALSQQTIATSDLMNTGAICQVGANSLSKYWAGVLQPKGINQEEPTPDVFAKALVSEQILKNGDYVEKATWLGSNGTQSFSNLSGMNLSNGFLYNLKFGTGAGSVISLTASGGVALTPTNAISTIQTMIGALPQDIADRDIVCFMSLPNYRTLVNALLDKQTFNSVFFVKDNEGGSLDWAFNWPYTFNVKIVATGGLIGRNDIIMTPPDNLYIGVDGEHDEEEFRVWFDPTYNSIFYRTMVRLGTAIAYPQYVVACFAPNN